MIPAILSCIFVAYLYRTLNAPEGTAANSDQAAGSATDSIQQRIQRLSSRLEQLNQSVKEGDR